MNKNLEMGDYLGGWPLDAITREGKRRQCVYRQNDAATGLQMLAGSHQKLEETRSGFSSRASNGSMARLILSDTNFGFLVSRIVQEYISVALSCSIVGNLLQQP